MTSDELLAAADRNMRTYWLAIAGVGPAPGRVERASVVMASSGLPAGLFNPAFLTERPADPAATVEALRSHYAEIGLPFVFAFRDSVAPGLADACIAAGLVEHFQPPLMVLDPIVASPAAPERVDIVTVDIASHADLARVLAEGYGMPLEFAAVAMPVTVLDMPGFSAFVALLDGVAVAASGVLVADGLAGVYNVATVPDARGRGIGAAVTWAAVAAGAAAGCTQSILQASAAGAPVYAGMGFATPDRYRQFEPA